MSALGVVSRTRLLALALTLGCGGPASDPPDAARPAEAQTRAIPALPSAPPATAAATAAHLQISGTRFVTPEGQAFSWRGITAFRLLEFVAQNKETEVRAYLAWARSQELTVVRVLAMGSGFMQLSPEQGRGALGRLLALAQEHGLHVEIVALANTRDLPVDQQAHVSAIGEIAGAHANALLEIANEPIHPSQAPEVGKADILKALAGRVPTDVPVALGSIETDERFSGGDYVTWHVPRETRPDGWGHVLAIAPGGALIRKFGKPVVSDEPIGAGSLDQPGRRDNRPARFRAAALLTRMTGMGATFHYEGGLQARIPEGTELACLEAWREAWTLLPPDLESHGTFAVAATPGAVVQGFDRAAVYGVFERMTSNDGWLLAVGAGEPGVTLASGWTVIESKAFEGVRLIRVARSTTSRTSP